jgi:transposase
LILKIECKIISHEIHILLVDSMIDQFTSISIEELHELLSETDERIPTQRILTAIAYKQGDSKERLAERHNVSLSTIYNWLNRFAEQPLEQAPYSAQRSGRPSKLTEEQQDLFFDHLRDSPEVFGYDRQEWSPTLVRRHMKDQFDVEYSLRHIARLMTEAGLSNTTVRQRENESDLSKEGGADT